MDNYFPIKIDDITLKVRKLNFKNYCGAFEIWKKDSIQFILVHNLNRSENRAWSVNYNESSNISQDYIDKIMTAIDSYYAK
jgi:hypothetical protein